MWRNSRQVILKAQSSIGQRIFQQSQRGASSAAGGVAKTLLWTTGALAVGAGGTIAYASYDPEFRQTVEKNVPPARDIFEAFLGESPRASSKPAIDIQRPKPVEESKRKETFQKLLGDTKEPNKPVSIVQGQKTEKTPTLESKLIESAPKLSPESRETSKPALSTPSQTIEQPKPIEKLEIRPSKSVDIGSQISDKLDRPTADFEDEIIKQMRRQAAAHAEHLEEAMKAQKEHLESQYRRDLDEAVLKERDAFNREVGGAIARLKAIESALEGRAEQDTENRRAKELWLACQHLKKAVLHGRAEGRDYTARKKPLVKEVTAIKEAGAADPFVKTLLGTINSTAVSDGVYTQEDLIDRFERVKKVCRRTALIGENGGSLFQYFLSTVQSVFLFDRIKPDAKQLQEVDPSNIDTVGILWRASHLVEELNFEDAVKLMLLLKGEPARLASDWIRDARLHLETRQTAELLLAHASAVSMRTIY